VNQRKLKQQTERRRRLDHSQPPLAPFCPDCHYRTDSEDHERLCEQNPEPPRKPRGWPFLD